MQVGRVVGSKYEYGEPFALTIYLVKGALQLLSNRSK